MTFSLRKLLLVAPVFVVVGIAAACSPYIGPLVNPPAPPGTATGIPAPQVAPSAPATPYASPSPTTPQSVPPLPDPKQHPIALSSPPLLREPGLPPVFTVPGWNLSIMDGKLHLQTMDGSRSTSEKMTILVHGCEPIAVAVADNLIRLTSGTDAIGCPVFLRADARQVTRTGPEGSTVILEGGAHLVYVRKGKKIDIAAERVSVNLVTGQLVIDTEPTPQPVVQPCCNTGATVPTPSSCKPSVPSFEFRY